MGKQLQDFHSDSRARAPEADNRHPRLVEADRKARRLRASARATRRRHARRYRHADWAEGA